ncbi:MAG TPA: Gfo/Idh/MocA family oxidoreductase [Methylomirabilota bacterium]|nr:Gfo/Idh/MocA family oxidoreductase [Methylomirabilota bacterium]
MSTEAEQHAPMPASGHRPLNVAIIGCGAVGQREAAAVSSIPDLRLVAISDFGPAFRHLALQMGSQYGCDTVHDWRHLVARNDIDIVVVATPNAFHREMSIEAMKQGKHVLCEKPLATTAEDAEEMVATARVTGARLMTNFNHRAHDHARRARQLLDQGRIGRPLFFRGRIGHSRFVVGGTAEAPTPFQGKPIWNLDPAQSGGGTLIDNGVHLLDLARWLMGTEFVEAEGFLTHNLAPGDQGPPGGPEGARRACEDNAFALLRAADGRVASIHSSWMHWQGYLYLEIFGTHGTLVVDNDQIQGEVSHHVFDRHGDPIASTIERPALAKPDPSWRRHLQELVDAIREGRDPSPCGWDGLRVSRMVDALYRSAASGKVERIPADAAAP